MTEPPDTLPGTRDALHQLAEHVVSPARYAVTGRIGLRPAPGGLCTPPFGNDDRVVEVDHSDLVVRDSSGERRAPVTTLRAAGEFVGVTPGAPADVYRPATPCDLDAPLMLDDEAMTVLAGWYALGAAALDQLAAQLPDATEAQLWPEHLDHAITAGRVNFGASPGDEAIADPYVYVGPFDGPPAGDEEFWNAPFGATRTMESIGTADEALAFFLDGWRRLS